MKYIAPVAAAALAATAPNVHAGSLDEPVVEAVEVIEEAKSGAGWLIPLVALGLVALAVSSSDDDEGGVPPVPAPPSAGPPA